MSLLSLYTPRYTPSVWPSSSSIWGTFASFEPLLDESRTFSPRFEVSEEDGETGRYTLKLDLPGFKREDMEVEIDHHNVLYVKASRAGKRGQKEILERSVMLGEDVNVDAVSAKLDHGVLSVVIQRREIPKAKRIEVG